MLSALAIDSPVDPYATDPGYTYTYQASPADSAAAAGLLGTVLIFTLVIVVLTVVGMWKVFTKAGKPGWAALIPFYNIYVMLQVIGRPTWWVLLYLAAFIPFIGGIIALVVSIIVMHDLAKSFGKDMGMTLLLIFFPFIGYLALGFGKAAYHGPSALQHAAPTQAPPVVPQPPAAPAA